MTAKQVNSTADFFSAAASGPPPPYNNPEEMDENQPLLYHPRTVSYASSMDMRPENENPRNESQKIGSAAFYAVAAGISFGGCRLLLQNIQLNVIDLNLTGAIVQVNISNTYILKVLKNLKHDCKFRLIFPSPERFFQA